MFIVNTATIQPSSLSIPAFPFPPLKQRESCWQKNLGFRIFMDLIPLDPSLVKGTHGVRPKDSLDWPVILGHSIEGGDTSITATGVHDLFTQSPGLLPELKALVFSYLPLLKGTRRVERSADQPGPSQFV
jgi:hypothetical protein